MIQSSIIRGITLTGLALSLMIEIATVTARSEEVTPFLEKSVGIFTCGDSITDRDGFSYKTVTIGNQCWLAENLKTKTKSDGTPLTNLAPFSERDCVGVGGVRGTETDCQAGYTLYTRAAALENSDEEGAQGLCPTGWHIPTDQEWHQIENFLTDSKETCDPFRINSFDCVSAGTKLQIGGKAGFNAPLSGYRLQLQDQFEGYHIEGNFWSSTIEPVPGYPDSIAWSRKLNVNESGTARWDWHTSLPIISSLAVRCVKDMPPQFTCGDPVTDRDGYIYKTVEIGTQCWMAENLKTKTKPDGMCINGGKAPCPDASPHDAYKGRSCYNNLEKNCDSDGALYNYQAALNNVYITPLTKPVGLVQGICPDGWHVPSPDEYTTLFRSVCTSTNCAKEFPYTNVADNDRGTTEGIRLKIGGDSGFNALLTGQRHSDGVTFQNRGLNSYLRTTMHDYLHSSSTSYRIVLYAGDNGKINRAYSQEYRAMPLRCIKN